MTVTLIDRLSEWKPRISSPIIITDHIVEELYGRALANQLGCDLISVPPGEMSKEIEPYYTVCRQMVQKHCTRKSTIIALGGGVVGDLAGFIAATYMRGISCIQVPTTLLGMVDSSIGGKVGINLPEGKNLLGAFLLPQEIVIALECLESLSDKELRSGLSEVIKYGIILDAPFFDWLEGNMDKLLNKERDALRKAVKRCVELKMQVVEQDAKEANLRQILNYGHTLGHAIEKVTRFQLYTHGEAIAIGMQFAGALAHQISGFTSDDLRRQNALLQRVHPHLTFPEVDADQLMEAMLSDKKAISGETVFVLPQSIGKMAQENDGYGIVVSQKVVHDALHSHYSPKAL